MGCPSVDAIQAYLDGQASAAERADLERHARGCASCRDVLALAQTSGPATPPGADAALLVPGTQVGRFVVEHVLGAGGMGVVYAARDPDLDRPVALKLLREESTERRERLGREAQALARIPSPNVCAVYEIGSHGGRLFVAMELVAGPTLAQWLRARPRGWRDVVPVFAAAARGVAAAHAAGVVHRDFKPDNVLVGDDGRVRVSDFGLAAWRSDATRAAPASPANAAVELTRSGVVLGTPLYMAPEQHDGRPADERSDQWSFAAALYEALHGRPPFGGRTEEEIAAEKRAGRLPPASRARIPRRLDRLVRRGLSPRPEDRMPSMAAFAAALERAPTTGRLAGLAAAAAVVALLAAGVVFLADRRDDAAEAARFSARAAAMEAALRIEHLEPAHDLRPALAKVRAEVERLRPEAARVAAASFALGKGLELLGEDDEARAAYERAWERGLRTAPAAEGLGAVLARLHEREERRARASLEGRALDVRLAALAAELATPAMRMLEIGGAEPWRAALHRGWIALLARDFAGARARAAEALAADPSRYEAHALEAEAWRAEAAVLHSDESHEQLPLLAQAAQAADAAARWGRSDPAVALVKVGIHEAIVDSYARLGQDAPAEMAALLAALDDAAALDPDAPAVLLGRGRALRLRADFALDSGADSAIALFEQAAVILRPLAARPDADVETLVELARVLAKLARIQSVTDNRDARPLIAEGLRALARARAKEPKEPSIHRVEQILHDDAAFILYEIHDMDGFVIESRLGIAAGEEVLRLGSVSAPSARNAIAQSRILLSDLAFRSGGDPRPELREAVKLIEAGRGCAINRR